MSNNLPVEKELFSQSCADTAHPVFLWLSSRKPKERKLSQDLIILLSIGGVPDSFFLELVRKALDDVQNIFTNREIAFRGTLLHSSVLASVIKRSLLSTLRDSCNRILMSPDVVGACVSRNVACKEVLNWTHPWTKLCIKLNWPSLTSGFACSEFLAALFLNWVSAFPTFEKAWHLCKSESF